MKNKYNKPVPAFWAVGFLKMQVCVLRQVKSVDPELLQMDQVELVQDVFIVQRHIVVILLEATMIL